VRARIFDLQIDEWNADDMGPADIELGDEVIEVERRSVRLSAEEADRLQDIAESRKTTLSRVAREAIVTYLANGRHQADDKSVTGSPRLTKTV
jgi:hypothetical protein